MLVPPGRAHDCWHVQFNQAAKIINRGFRRGKFYGHVHSRETFLCESFAAHVVINVEVGDDLVAARNRGLLDHMSHLTVTDDCDLHDPSTFGLVSFKSGTNTLSPSSLIAAIGQPSIACLHSSSSSGVDGCLYT